jgi:phosphohistidine phosphatase
MKTVLILRHAKSSWDDPSLDDFDRPLNKRGEKDAPRVGKWLRKEGLLPDVILCSAARRARQTAESVAQAAHFEGMLEFDERFYDCNPSTWVEALQSMPERVQRVLLVGHNPTLEELLAALCGVSMHLPTAAVAQVNLPLTKWAALAERVPGNLVLVWQPRKKENGEAPLEA